jgi:hypothetical protein
MPHVRKSDAQIKCFSKKKCLYPDNNFCDDCIISYNENNIRNNKYLNWCIFTGYQCINKIKHDCSVACPRYKQNCSIPGEKKKNQLSCLKLCFGKYCIRCPKCLLTNEITKVDDVRLIDEVVNYE